MRNNLICAGTGAFLSAWVAIAGAQAARGDAALGERIAIQGGGDAVTACAVCHGSRGEGMPVANFPPLAGLPLSYLRTQLERFADGSRDHPIMTSIARAMSVRQREAAAAYYAGLPAKAP